MPWRRLIGPLMVYISWGTSVGDAMITCRGVQTLPCGQVHHIRQERGQFAGERLSFLVLLPSNKCTKFLAWRAYAICVSAPP